MTTQTTATGKIFTEILRWFTIQKDFFGKLVYKIIRQNKLKEFTGSGVEYWEQRHEKFGARSVVNLAHPEEEFEKVTRMQKERLFTILKKQLSGNENLILDFGCGPGRFTGGLADSINGKAIGVEPSRHLLSLAPKNPNVEYRIMKEGEIPAETVSIDVVWVCLVLSIIVDERILRNTIDEVDRVLKKDGSLFLVANTTDGKQDLEYIKFRSVQKYQEYFNFLNLRHISDYFDLGERISIMAGKKI